MPALSELANAGSVTDSLSQVVCGDCGAILSDWILDPRNRGQLPAFKVLTADELEAEE